MNDNTINAQDVKVLDAVKTYSDRGFLTTPVTPGQKKTPATDTTGRRVTPEEKRVNAAHAWEIAPDNANVALSLLPGLAGLDVDHYEDGTKQGWIYLRELFAEHGLNIDDYPWEEWPRSTRRGVDSAGVQFFFRVPEDLEYTTKPCTDVEMVQATHRYSMVWPSVVEGMQYRWYKGDKEMDTLPEVADLPKMPAELVPVFARGPVRSAGSRVDEESLSDSLKWLEARVFGGESRAELPDDVYRYDTMVSTVMALISNAVHNGHAGLMADLKEIRERREDYEVSERRAVSDDYAGAVTSAVAKVKAEIASGLKQDINWRERFGAEPFPDNYALPDFGDLLAKQAEAYLAEMIEEEQTSESLEDRRAAAVAAVEASAPEDYWQTQPVLAEIAHYATRASVDKYSLLFRVLTYLSAEMPPTVYLEDMDQPLTLYSAVIAESGAGKGVLDKVADALVGQYLYNGDPVLRPGTGNLHTLLTALGDFTRPETKKNEDGTEEPLPMKKHRMLIQGNELAAWAEMQGNAEWAGAMADVFDGQGDYEVRNTANCYHFGVNQHSLAVTFSVQPDAAGYLFASTGRGLPGRFLISALPPLERVLPEDFDPWDLDSDFEVDTFDPARDVSRLKINSRFFLETGPFHLSDDARRVNARLKRAWDEELGEYKQLRAEKIFSQMPKVKLRVAVLLTVLLDLGEGREVPLEALRMADFLLKVSVENTRYARDLADAEERRGNAAVAAERKRADADADLSLAKENVLAVIDKSPNGKAGLGRINDRKRATAEHHPAAIAELVAEGVLEVIKTPKAPDAYKRV